LRDEWIDSATGHRVVRLSRLPGTSEGFYFHQNAFTPEGDKMVYFNLTTNDERRLAVYDWRSGQSELLNDRDAGGAVVARGSRQVFFLDKGEVCVTDLGSRKTRLIATLPRRWHGLTVNADETLLAGGFSVGGPEIARGAPKSTWFDKVFDAHATNYLFTIEIATGKTNILYEYPGWLGHIQFSPTDPRLLMFCHEGPWHKLDRIWTIRTDGSGLRLMHARSVTNEIAGHEFWSPDGKTIWFDLQVPRGQTFFLAGADVETLKETRYPVERNQWSVHYNISRDGKLFAGDGGAENMVAHAPDGKWLYLFRPQPDGTLKAERLCRMAAHDYELEPNVKFTPDAKWIVFNGNMDGPAQVYAVEVAKAQ
jgi:oligogalacturonide lyase